eukprot:TRINITY_DN4412_c0_g1_i1.p1 TRINITY_DN4412_c0_g1~~TRINITY_DN4412_c0_g1_i1.p1  ORF type:complete len:173 (-),score=25.37 TRINITY_DN4412_c0_g1_i1:197-715(-)
MEPINANNLPLEPYVFQVAVKDSHKETKRACGLPKQSVRELVVGTSGAEGDYNRYRTTHKSSTNNRALSLITLDILNDLTKEGWGPVLPGDLGENITVAGNIRFAIEQKYRMGTVVLQITEEIQPCNNLMNLPYVGRERKNAFLSALKRRRGWYAKVHETGVILPGDVVEQL